MTLTSADVPTKRPTVLVADDEAALTDSMAVWLSDDYRVRTAYDGHEAVSAFGPSVDVVLLDRRMPGLSGERVLERLREAEANAQVALLTATSVEEFGPEVTELDFDAHLTKPISRDELLDAVSDLASASEPPQH
jgi:CheY-like chemotaxis protein